jgi:hypothetical protein
MASSDAPSGGDRDVLTSLPSTRPHRRSAKRDPAPAKAGAKAGAKARPKAAPVKASAKPTATARPRPKAKPRAAPKPPPVPPAGYATPRADDDVPHGADLVATVVQAAGELAQIGIAAGGRAFKAALQRLPRP